MAHIQVTRRSMRDDEWCRLRVGWIERRVIVRRFELEGWRIREARQIGECAYEYDDDAPRPLGKGDTFFSPDGTTFLELDAVVPPELDGQPLWMELVTAAEMQVRCNGCWAGGLDPNRERVLLLPSAQAGQPLWIEIEGYNRSKPDDERSIATRERRGCRQTFPGAALVIIDPEIEAAMYDTGILMDAVASSRIREEIRAYILLELGRALDFVDPEETDPATYRQGIVALRQHLQRTVFQSKRTRGFGGCGKVALVAHSHLDIAYYWRRLHAVQKNARTCMVQLRLMERYPEFHYAHTQPFVYETLEKHYPELFEELRTRVKEGRFEPVGGMYVEPDCNIPAAESLVRQCLYGQHYYRSRFGKTASTCWLPDVFGNSWILPQILRKAGMEYFVSNKISTWNDTNRFPHNHFVWRGIDGTDIKSSIPPTHFITWNTPEQIAECWDAFQDKQVCAETMNMFGFGDGGSGVTDRMLEYLRRMNDVPGLPEVRHGTGEEFLRQNLEQADELAVWDGELYLEMHRGTFTTKGELKRENRQLEILLRDTELLCAWATRTGAAYPREELTAAWKLLLVNQFHDILPGTHIAPVTRDALADYAHIRKNVSALKQRTLSSLAASAIHGKRQTATRALLNTLSWPRSGVFFLPDPDNAASPALPEGVTQAGTLHGESGYWVKPAAPLPALGTQSCMRVASGTGNEAVAAATSDWFTFENLRFQSDRYRLQFAPDGSIVSLIDVRTGRELVAASGTLNRIRVYHDYPGNYDAWDILPNYTEKEETVVVERGLEQECAGAVMAQFSVVLRVGGSRLTMRIRIFRDAPRIEFEHDVDWQERNRLAKAEFDLNLLARHARCDTGAGTVLRETHRNTSWEQARFEVCHHQWADLSEGDFGVALLNDGKYGIGFDRNRMSLSLLRGSIRPDPCADEGRHRFLYALLPHEGLPESAGVVEAARELNTPVVTASAPFPTQPLLSLDAEGLHVQSVKLAEEGNAWIVRLVETRGRRGEATLSTSFPLRSAYATDLLEDATNDPRVRMENGGVRFGFTPFEIVTLKLEPGVS